FAGACWESSPSSPVNAPTAARKCAARGGTLPEALQLAAFAEEPGISLSGGDEWSSDILSFSSEDVYAVATVSQGGNIDAGLFNAGGVKETHAYRCVVPLVR
ncbi:MAG TPA: hypothetical protein VH703_07360, partial [Solirubrobacterales bacterium]